jgi:hypothetical protein
MDNLKKLKQKIRDYSEYKKAKKIHEQEKEQYFKDMDKQQEQENFEMFKENKYGVEVKKNEEIKVKKAFLGAFMKKMLYGKGSAKPDSSEQYRQTFNVKDSETGETKNIMQNFKATPSQNNFNNDTGLIGRLFGPIRNKPTQEVGPLKHDFYVKDNAGQNINIAEKKFGGLIRQGYPKIAKKGWK